MRFQATVFSLALILTSVGCTSAFRETRKASPAQQSPESAVEYEKRTSGDVSSNAMRMSKTPAISENSPAYEKSGGGGGGGRNHASPPVVHSDSITDDASSVSLASLSTVYAASDSIDRKIIRNGELTLETESPTEGLRKITVAAESHGGFVVTSEFKQNPVSAGTKPSQNVTVVARVPSSQFAAALDQIRNAGERVVQEKVSGQDVSEEYLDVEARLRNKKALEGQFLEIMKQARKVQDALDVQTQLADVRTEIERLEGRRRFLENQAALSTITTTLQMPQPIIAATTAGFGATIKQAFGDAVDTAASIVLFVIQAVIVLVPIAFFFGLPLWLIWRVLRRRVLFFRKPEPSPIPDR